MLRLTSLAILFFISILTGCKKNPFAPQMWEFSFTYNGQTYSNPDNGSPLVLDGDVIGVEIRKPDVLGGLVTFIWTNNCAYTIPTGMDITYNQNSCTFFSTSPVDSSLIYRYKSGGKDNYSISNCKDKKDPWSGATVKACTISGTFTLVLINNAGDTKNITGKFKLPDVFQ